MYLEVYYQELGSNELVSRHTSAVAESSKINLRYDDLLGIIEWLQSAGEVRPEQHPAALKFFEFQNPQPNEFVNLHPSRHIQIAIVKLDKPQEEFTECALGAATKQGKLLYPSTLVVQQGALQSDDKSMNQAY